MKSSSFRAHFDGDQIRLDEPCELEPGTRLTVTIVEAEEEQERTGWQALALHSLAAAYSDDEPDYPASLIKEPNPEYEAR